MICGKTRYSDHHAVFVSVDINILALCGLFVAIILRQYFRILCVYIFNTTFLPCVQCDNDYFYDCDVAALGEPRKFHVQVVGSRNLSFFWLPPATKHSLETNISYTLSCQSVTDDDDNDILMEFPVAQSGLTMNVFQPFTMYSCSVYAKNHSGRGPAATTSAMTLQDGKIPHKACTSVYTVN